MRYLRRADGVTLIEFVVSLAIAALVLSSIYLLLGAVIKGRFIAHARVSDQERARQAMAWLADRLRQVNYDQDRPCPEGFILIGNGDTFAGRLAFRAILEDPTRRTYVYYVEGPAGQQTLYQETRDQEDPTLCADETTRTGPDLAGRIALTPPIVQSAGSTCTASPFRFFCYFDENGVERTDPTLVHSMRITMSVEARSLSGQPPERQTYQTVASLRGP
jgi:prepilin-type N-terminal cleavage/methylation domain-containing protein